MKPPQTIIIFVPGINTFPGDAENWNLRALTWTQQHSDCRVQTVEYFCGPIGRAFGQQRRAAKLMALLQAFAGWRISLVGHSNGTAVILLALELAGWPKLEALHLVSAACEADFWKNGLNQALGARRPAPETPGLREAWRLRRVPRRTTAWARAQDRPLGTIGKVGVYIGEADRALRLAHGWAGRLLGYGVLGLHGPRRVAAPVADKVWVRKWPGFGHSTCWAPEHFEQTMKLFLP